MGKVLVTGGAGYIGSFTVHALLREGYEVTVLDSLELGHREAVPKNAAFLEADLNQIESVRTILTAEKPESIIHFAAYSQVGESVQLPWKYYRNNIGGTSNLVTAASETGVKNFVFSSTAATYGDPQGVLTEDHPTLPINPYGRSKLASENLLRDAAAASGLRVLILRYFNAAGAAKDGSRGEDHSPETHLVPNVMGALMGIRPLLKVFGTDYPTRDGSCERDFVHVEDLAQAHVRGCSYLSGLNAGSLEILNVGTGKGTTVLEVLRAAHEVGGKEVPHIIEGRRAGDPAVLVANSDKIRKVLGWRPEFTDIRDILLTEQAWITAHPRGYAG